MRCLLCDAGMVLINVVTDNTIGVPGFERHTLQCPSCGDVEQRLVFGRGAPSREAEHLRVASPPVSPASTPASRAAASHESEHVTAPSVSPASTLMSEPVDAPGVWARALARLRGRSSA